MHISGTSKPPLHAGLSMPPKRCAAISDTRNGKQIIELDRPIPTNIGDSFTGSGTNAAPGSALAEFLQRKVSAEPLVDVRELGIAGENYYNRTDGRNAPYFRRLDGAIAGLFVRRDIAAKLVVAEAIARGHGMRLFVHDALRTAATQTSMFEHFRNEWLAQNPQRTPAEAHLHALRFASDPHVNMRDTAIAPLHTTGAAVDLVLQSDSGETLDFGGEFDETTDRSRTVYYESSHIPHESASYNAPVHNRRFLYNLMEAVGLHNYPEEYWHYNGLNRMGAQSYFNKHGAFEDHLRPAGFIAPPYE